MSRRIALAICVFVVLLFVAAVGVLAVPPLPSSFWGVAYVDDTPVPLTTPIVAWVGDTPYPATRAMSGTVPAYVVNVGGSETWDPSAGDPPEEGASIVFKIGDLVTDQEPVWHQGEHHPDYVLTASRRYSIYDFNEDWQITVADIQAVAAWWGCSSGDACYNERYDLDGDDDIDIVDIMMVASRWGCQLGDDCYYDGVGMLATSPVESTLPTGPAGVHVEPVSTMAAPDETFTVTVKIADAVDVGAFQLDLNFDSAVVHVQDVTLGDFPGSTGRNGVPLGPRVDNDAGTMTFGTFSFGSQPGANGDGTLAIVTLTTQRTGLSPLHLENVQVVGTNGEAQAVTIEDGRVTVGVPRRIYLPLHLAAMGSQAQTITLDGERHIVRGPLRVYLPVIVRR